MKREIQKAVKCPIVGRPVFIEDEPFYGLSCVHCEYYGGIKGKGVNCHYSTKDDEINKGGK